MPDRTAPLPSDAAIIAALEDLGRHLAVPTGGDLSGAVRARIAEAAPRPGRSRWALVMPAVAAAVAVVVAGALLLPGPREAVARWLGIGGVRITVTTSPPADVTGHVRIGDPMTTAEAADAVAFTPALPSIIDPPTAAYTGRPPGSVTFMWPSSSELPEVGDSGIGLLLTELPGGTSDTLVDKEIGPGTSIEVVAVDDRDAFWITGDPHTVVYLDPRGEPTFDEARLAGNTLVWGDEAVTYRLESALDLDRAIELAESLVPMT